MLLHNVVATVQDEYFEINIGTQLLGLVSCPSVSQPTSNRTQASREIWMEIGKYFPGHFKFVSVRLNYLRV